MRHQNRRSNWSLTFSTMNSGNICKQSAGLFFFYRVPAVLFPVLLVLSLSPGSALTQVRDPDLPVSPEIEYNRTIERKTWSATVSYAGGSVECDIDPGAEYFTDSSGVTRCYWKDISTILITSWVRYVRGKRYAFYPETYEITLKSGLKQQLKGNIKELNRIRVVKKKKQHTMYTYYYDDYLKGAWVSTGTADFYSPVLKPAQGCVVSITLL